MSSSPPRTTSPHPSAAPSTSTKSNRRVQPQRTRRGGIGVGSSDVDLTLLDTIKRKNDNEPIEPARRGLYLTTDHSQYDSAMATKAENNASGSGEHDALLGEKYFEKPEVILSCRAQADIQMPVHRMMQDKDRVGGKLRPRDDGKAADTRDSTYEKVHKQFETFEKRNKAREKEKLTHEHHKLKQRMEQLRSIDSASFMSLPPDAFVPWRQIVVLMDEEEEEKQQHHLNGFGNGHGHIEGERRRDVLLEAATGLEERYRTLLPPPHKVRKLDHPTNAPVVVRASSPTASSIGGNPDEASGSTLPERARSSSRAVSEKLTMKLPAKSKGAARAKTKHLALATPPTPSAIFMAVNTPSSMSLSASAPVPQKKKKIGRPKKVPPSDLPNGALSRGATPDQGRPKAPSHSRRSSAHPDHLPSEASSTALTPLPPTPTPLTDDRDPAMSSFPPIPTSGIRGGVSSQHDDDEMDLDQKYDMVLDQKHHDMHMQIDPEEEKDELLVSESGDPFATHPETISAAPKKPPKKPRKQQDGQLVIAAKGSQHNARAGSRQSRNVFGYSLPANTNEDPIEYALLGELEQMCKEREFTWGPGTRAPGDPGTPDSLVGGEGGSGDEEDGGREKDEDRQEDEERVRQKDEERQGEKGERPVPHLVEAGDSMHVEDQVVENEMFEDGKVHEDVGKAQQERREQTTSDMDLDGDTTEEESEPGAERQVLTRERAEEVAEDKRRAEQVADERKRPDLKEAEELPTIVTLPQSEFTMDGGDGEDELEKE